MVRRSILSNTSIDDKAAQLFDASDIDIVYSPATSANLIRNFFSLINKLALLNHRLWHR